MNILYHALFVDNPDKLMKMFPPVHPNLFYHHLTIEFKPKDTSNIEVGKKVRLPIIGRITTNRVDALLVSYPKSKNKYSHITLSTAAGVKPFESNTAFEQNPEMIERYSEASYKYIDATEGYFENNSVII